MLGTFQVKSNQFNTLGVPGTGPGRNSRVSLGISAFAFVKPQWPQDTLMEDGLTGWVRSRWVYRGLSEQSALSLERMSDAEVACLLPFFPILMQLTLVSRKLFLESSRLRSSRLELPDRANKKTDG